MIKIQVYESLKMHPYNRENISHLPAEQQQNHHSHQSMAPPKPQFYERSHYSQPPNTRVMLDDSRRNLSSKYALNTPANRPTLDPTYYDNAFHSQTRPNVQKTTTASGDVIAYQLYAPKFENHQDSSGRADTWTPRGNQPLSSETKRGHRVPFPSRCAPKVQQPIQSTASHPMENRRVVRNTTFDSAGERVDHFNRSIDGMHLSEDLQRPIPTRTLARSEAEQNEVKNPSADLMFTERQFSLDNMSGGLPLQGGGNFEDMFY